MAPKNKKAVAPPPAKEETNSRKGKKDTSKTPTTSKNDKKKAAVTPSVAPAAAVARRSRPAPVTPAPSTTKWNFGITASQSRRGRRNNDDIAEKATNSSGLVPSKVIHDFEKGTGVIDIDVIHAVVVCRLCDGYIVDATTIIDCLHSFCKSCLLLYFEEDETTCPTCGISIHQSHPAQYVTYDRALNDLVMNLVPGLSVNERSRREEFVKNVKTQSGVDNSRDEELKRNEEEKERIRGTNRCYEGMAELSHHREDNQVVVQLLPGSTVLPLVARNILRTSEMTTINSLKKFLALSLWDDQSRYMDLDIFCDSQLMGKDFSIRFVWMTKRRDQPRHIPLQLFYRLSVSS